MARKVTIRFEDTDKGFRKLAASLGEMGQITIGVQGKEADARHDPEDPESPTVGELAAMHELGLGGMHSRSFVRAWIDDNAERMVRETAEQFRAVLARTTTRNAALIKLGYAWTADMQKRMDDGRVTPPISDTTAKRKGHARPLIETYKLRNAVSYKVFIPNIRSIRDPAQRRAIRKP
jgi:hypothetical protein